MTTETDFAVNIMAAYKRATPAEIADGTGWYARAREIALEISPDDVWRGAGILATLSPMKEWSENVRLARLAVATGKATGNVPSATGPCQKILDGMSWDDAMKGPKTRSFCIAIATAGRGEVATIDAHAHDAAMAQSHAWAARPTITKGTFNAMDAAYREVAEYLGLAVNDLQAIVWVVWKREKKEARKRAA
jgi:hypothetical protein